MMRVISEQKKSLYLKAYVGSVYKDGVWRKMPEGQDHCNGFDNFPYRKSRCYMHQQQWKLSVHMEFQQDTWKDTILEHPKSKTAKMGEVSITGENAHAWGGSLF